jgi:phosphohistidine phosphatase
MASDRDEAELVLWRHAEAEDGMPDAERALTKKGHKQAEAVGHWLASHLPKRALILASPAKRAQQTAAAVNLPITTVEAIAVGASAGEVLRAAGWPDASGVVVVVGHQPTLGRVAALLLTGAESEWPIKKGAVWWFTSRVRNGERKVALRAVIGPDLL